MRAEIIAFGDELIRGQRINTNTAWLSRHLAELGAETRLHVVAGDDVADSVDVLRAAVGRASVVVCSGGLGPTADDLTRQAIAAAFDRPLELRVDVLEHIRALFQHRGRRMPERNREQALFPLGSRPIDNPQGTAPGIELLLGDPWPVVVALPGVPVELEEMWPAVAERLQQLGIGREAIRQRVLQCFGVGESHLEEMIAEYTVRDRNPLVGITVHDATITLTIQARAHSEAECQSLLDDTRGQLCRTLGDLVFGEGSDQLQDVVARSLIARGQTLALMEVGTHATASAALSSAAGSSAWFRGACVLPDHRPGISGEPALRRGALPEETCLQMAQACRVQFQADFGLALVYSASDGDSVWIGIDAPDTTRIVEHRLMGHSKVVMNRAVKTALDLLRKTLASMPDRG